MEQDMTSFRLIRLGSRHGWLSNALLEVLRSHPRRFVEILQAKHDPVVHRRSMEEYKLMKRRYHHPALARVRTRPPTFQKKATALTAHEMPTILLTCLPRTMSPPPLHLVLAQR
jgi:hypothetical protein